MPPQKPGSSLENFVFYLSLLLLAAVIGGFFYLQYLAGQKDVELANASAAVAKAKTVEQKNLEDSIAVARQQLSDFSAVISQRKISVNFLEKFEDLVFSEVYFTRCNLDLTGLKVSFSGHASSFEVLGWQIAAFESAADVFDKVNLGKVAISEEGGIDFDLEIVIKQSMVALN